MNRRPELVIEKDRLELVMNRRLEYVLPFFANFRINIRYQNADLFCKVSHFWAMESVKTRRLTSRNCPFRGKGDIIQLENASNKRVVDAMEGKWSSWKRPWLLAGWLVGYLKTLISILKRVRSSGNSKTSGYQGLDMTLHQRTAIPQVALDESRQSCFKSNLAIADKTAVP